MFSNVATLAIAFLINGTILLALLWIMIKFQKLDYNFLGLLGSAALGTGLDMIPHVGHFLAVPVLYICIWKVTRSCIFPDAAYTVMISYALMFCVNLFILGALMGDLRPSAREVSKDEDLASETNSKAPSAVTTNNPHPVTDTNLGQTADAKRAEEIARLFTIKGITRNADKSSLTLQSGKKTYVISLGQLISVQTDDGPVSVRFADLGADSVTLTIKGTQVKRPLHSQ